MGGGRTPGVPVMIVTGVLLLAGLIEVASVIVKVSGGGAAAVAGLAGPALLLPFTVASLLATVGGRATRIAACFGATVAFVVRLVLVGLLLVPGWRFPPAAVLENIAGAVTGLGLLGFTLYLVLRHRDLSNEPVEEAAQAPSVLQPRPAAQPPAQATPSRSAAPSPVAVATTARPGPQRRLPESPSTPVDVSLRARGVNPGGPWATASTPWPRANEDDPNGTLIRPPRR